MAVTYRELTLDQQAGLVKTKLFEYEYNHFQAALEAAALPQDPTRSNLVEQLDALVNEAQTEYDKLLQQAVDAGVELPGVMQVDVNNGIETGVLTPSVSKVN